MRVRHGYVIATLRGVKSFLDTNEALFGARIIAARRSIDDVVDQLQTLAVDQDFRTRSSRGKTAHHRTLCDDLRAAHMRPIAEVARQKLGTIPEFAALRMPRGNCSPTRLVAAALAMADAAEVHADVFTDVGLPDGFLTELRQAVALATETLDDRDGDRVRRRGATVGLDEQERRARSLIRLVDALVVPVLRSNEELLGRWRAARSIRRVRVMSAATEVLPLLEVA